MKMMKWKAARFVVIHGVGVIAKMRTIGSTARIVAVHGALVIAMMIQCTAGGVAIHGVVVATSIILSL